MKLLIITQKVDKNDQLLGFFIEWLKRLAKNFDKLIVLCLEKGEYDLPANVEVISFGKDLGAGKLNLLSTFYFLLFSRHNDYGAVFVHMNPIWMVLGGLCWKIMRKKRFLWYTSGGVTFKLKIAEKFADKTFTASSESFRLKSNKVIVTGHGIDTELFKPVGNVRNDGSVGSDRSSEAIQQLDQAKRSNNPIRILSVGRISPVKNYETLVNAVKILTDKGVDFKVTLIGEPALDSDKLYLANLKFKVKNLKLEDKFNFAGKVNHDNLPRYYQSHDVFVHLSKTGSLDKTLLEAMASGINTISSSDSAKAILPKELLFKEDDASDLSTRLQFVIGKKFGLLLRNMIIKNHDLGKLIDTLTKNIQS